MLISSIRKNRTPKSAFLNSHFSPITDLFTKPLIFKQPFNMRSVLFMLSTIGEETVENRGMQAGATVGLFARVGKRATRAGTGHLQDVYTLRQTFHGASLSSNDEVNMVVIGIIALLLSARSVSYLRPFWNGRGIADSR